MTDTTVNFDQSRWRRPRVVAIVLAIVAVVAVLMTAIAVSGGGDETESSAVGTDLAADVTSPSAADGATPPATLDSSGSETDDGGSDGSESEDSETASTTPGSAAGNTTSDSDDPTEPTIAPFETDPVNVELPDLPAIQDTEAQTCNSVRDGLIAYREIVVESPFSALLTLRLGLAEFEDVSDFVADGQDWGVRMVEQLTLVRRDWSTAYTADGEGDDDVAEARRESALGYLDAAIDVPCPDDE